MKQFRYLEAVLQEFSSELESHVSHVNRLEEGKLKKFAAFAKGNHKSVREICDHFADFR